MKKILFMLLLLVAVGVTVVYGSNYGRADRGQRSDAIQKLKRELTEQKKANTLLKKQIVTLRELCKKAGITYNQIRDALRDKGTKEPLAEDKGFSLPLAVGQRSALAGDNRLIAREIVDSEKVIAELIIGYQRQPGTIPRGSRFLTMVPTNTPSVKISRMVWIKGMINSGLVHGSKIRCKNVFEITGTKTYETTDGGSNTIFVMQPVLLPAE